MGTRKTFYQQQQQYYTHFAFFPIEGLKRHNGFVYKMYTPAGNTLRQVFEHSANMEVTDRSYIVAIIKKIKEQGIPLAIKAIRSLGQSIKSLKKALRNSGYEKHFIRQQLNTMEPLQHYLLTYQEALFRKLVSELGQILDNDDFASPYEITAENIQHTLTIMNNCNKEVWITMSYLNGFLSKKPLAGSDLIKMEQPWNCVNSTVNDLERFQQVQHEIIYLFEIWENIRTAHEKQEVMN